MANPASDVTGEQPITGEQPQADPWINRVIDGRYKILSLVAKGGMGRVYRAEQAPLGRICALKVLDARYAGDKRDEFNKRFFLEAASAAKLNSPNTVKVFDYGRVDDETYFMAMELLQGQSLYRTIKQEAPFRAKRAISVAMQIARSLREAHNMEMVHRDLKPGNVFLIAHDDDQDFVKVLDFGLVKDTSDDAEELTEAGIVAGSPKYMAPEQIRREKVTPATDVYALGVLLYEMLCSRPPFDSKKQLETLYAHLNSEPAPIQSVAPTGWVPNALAEVVHKCLAKKDSDRYPSMDALLAALKETANVLVKDRMTQTLPAAARADGDTSRHSIPKIPTGDNPKASLPPPEQSSGSSTGPTSTPALKSMDLVAVTAKQPQNSSVHKASIFLFVGSIAMLATVVVLLQSRSSAPTSQTSRVTTPTPTVIQPSTQPPANVQPSPVHVPAPVANPVVVNTNPSVAVIVTDAGVQQAQQQVVQNQNPAPQPQPNRVNQQVHGPRQTGDRPWVTNAPVNGYRPVDFDRPRRPNQGGW